MTETGMNSIAVFDLDGTLIPYDSFSRLVRGNLLKMPSLLIAALLRRSGKLDRLQFAQKAQFILHDLLSSTKETDALCSEIIAAIPHDRRRLIEQWKTSGAMTILLSASPADYVVPLGQKLGFDQSFGSGDFHGVFRHLHGIGKRQFIDENFPASQWRRAFAIADHPSDEALLEAFDEVVRV
jgi:phosphoserine phosphatase